MKERRWEMKENTKRKEVDEDMNEGDGVANPFLILQVLSLLGRILVFRFSEFFLYWQGIWYSKLNYTTSLQRKTTFLKELPFFYNYHLLSSFFISIQRISVRTLIIHERLE